MISLNLRIHIMRDVDDWVHAAGARLNNDHIQPADIVNEILPEVNRVWKQAGVRWVLESVVEEAMVRTTTHEQDVAFVMAAARDAEGRSDPERLPLLNQMMAAKHRSTTEQLAANTNLFHIYLFPFVGNSSQGNAMRRFDGSTVVSTWSNKYKRQRDRSTHCAPQRRPFSESWDVFVVGSIGQTIAHEVGHVLGLRHDACVRSGGCLMKSNGYVFNTAQICHARQQAHARTRAVR
ncbi:MAG: hypothetical protein ACI8RZ_001669 [Myxococcota bacterium]|jgi:hypothetical protein